MYTVSRASHLTGVPSATLRKWEQRYGVVTPSRTEGNYRLYDDEAIRRLVLMRDLVDAGWSARDAAQHVLTGGSAAAERPASAQGGDLVGTPDGDDELRALARCARDFDAWGLQRLLDKAFAAGDPAEVVDRWLIPSLVEMGEAWTRGEVTVAGEHFASAVVQGRLARLYEGMDPAPVGAPRVMVGLARGSRHELGVLAFSVVLRTHGLDVTYLGGDLPVEDWVSSVRTLSPDAVVVGVPLVEDVPAVRELVAALTPHARVLLGGAFQDRVEEAEALGHGLADAARGLALRLGERPGATGVDPALTSRPSDSKS